MSEVILRPNVSTSKRSPNLFPSECVRLAGEVSPKSYFYECGYSADMSAGVSNAGVPNLKTPDGFPLTDAEGNYIGDDFRRSDVDLRGCMGKLGKNL